MIYLRLIIARLAIFIMPGFSSIFNIKVVRIDHGSPSFKMSQFKIFGNRNEVELNSFLVVKRNTSGEWDLKKPMWAFDLSPGSAKPLSKIVYAQVPSGFKEVAKAKVLIHGVSYLAVGFAPGSSGSTEFVAQ
jgi:hypothetical protein